VSINASRVATVGIPSPDWNGAETITFNATDPGNLWDADSATFNVTAVTYTISGIIQVGGIPLEGVLVTAHSPWTGTAITDADGKYELTGVPYGETTIHITPTLAGYTFNPPTITVTGPITAPVESENFAATLTGILPSTYAKIPFAIVQSGFTMLGQILDALGSTLGLPTWLNSTVMDVVGEWVGGPLSWSVDMLAWGLDLAGEVVGGLQPILTAMNVSLPLDLGDLTDLLDIVACKLLMPWNPAASTTNFTPCG